MKQIATYFRIKRYKALFVAAIWICSTQNGRGQTAAILVHPDYNDFNASANPGTATTLWFSLHVKLDGSQLTNNGDRVIFSNGNLSFTNIATSFGQSSPLPNGEVLADNTVSEPTTSFNGTTNTWVTRVPLSYSSSDLFIAGAAINSSNGFAITGGSKATTLSGNFSANTNFSSSWFYGLAAYQPTFTNATAGSINAAQGMPLSGKQTGTPISQMNNLVQGGSGGGGSDFTGSYSSTDPFVAIHLVSLPLTWVSFGAYLNNNEAVLDWTVANPDNVNRFYAEKSADGDSWSELGNLPFQKDQSNYSITDQRPAPGMNYYRIREVDFNGEESLSPVEMVTSATSEHVSVWPNPAKDIVNIVNDGANNDMKATIFDEFGKLMAFKVIKPGNNQISLGSLPIGTYILHIQKTNGTETNQKVIKR